MDRLEEFAWVDVVEHIPICHGGLRYLRCSAPVARCSCGALLGLIWSNRCRRRLPVRTIRSFLVISATTKVTRMSFLQRG